MGTGGNNQGNKKRRENKTTQETQRQLLTAKRRNGRPPKARRNDKLYCTGQPFCYQPRPVRRTEVRKRQVEKRSVTRLIIILSKAAMIEIEYITYRKGCSLPSNTEIALPPKCKKDS